MKKTLALTLALTLVLALLSCVAPALAEEVIEISMASWRTEDVGAWEQINAEFMKEFPNIKPTFNPIKNTEYDSYVQAAVASNTADDVLMVRSFDAGLRLFDTGALLVLSEDELPNLADMPIGTKTPFMTTDGQIYAAPEGLVYLGFLYNKKIFADNGIEVPQTWDDLYAACEKLKAAGIIPIAQGAKDYWTIEELLACPAVYSFTGGGEWVTKLMAREADFTDPGFIEMLEALNKLKAYFPDGYDGIGYTDTQMMFISEMAAIYVSGSFETFYLEQMNPDLDFGCFPSPKKNADDPVYVNANVSFGYGINANGKNIEACKTYVNWLCGEKGAQLLGDLLPGFYSRHPKVTSVANARASEWLKPVLPDSSNVFLTYTYNQMKLQQPDGGTLLSEAIARMWAGEYTPEQAAQHINDGMSWFFKK